MKIHIELDTENASDLAYAKRLGLLEQPVTVTVAGFDVREVKVTEPAPEKPAPEKAPKPAKVKATAPVATAPVATAPVATAPVATAPVATAPVATAPVATAPVATAPVVDAVPAPTIDELRTKLVAYAKLSNQDAARALVASVGGASSLVLVPEEKRALLLTAVADAIRAAMKS
jgi:hypothetical protein